MNKLIFPLVAGFGAAIAISILSFADLLSSDVVLLMAPFGATAVLVFGVPESPLAQPKKVIFGHLITAFIGVFFVQFIGVTPLTFAIATGLGISAMLFTKTTHPPAGANPILIMQAAQGWQFLVTPVLVGAVLLVVVARLVHTVYSRSKLAQN